MRIACMRQGGKSSFSRPRTGGDEGGMGGRGVEGGGRASWGASACALSHSSSSFVSCVSHNHISRRRIKRPSVGALTVYVSEHVSVLPSAGSVTVALDVAGLSSSPLRPIAAALLLHDQR